MVYKKYVYKNGGRHGPYYYHSYRDGNKIRKIYIGGEKEYRKFLNPKNRKKWFIAPAIVLLIVVIFFVFQFRLTGKLVLEIQDSYIYGENLSGILRLGLKNGELLPLESKLVISQNNTISEIPLADLIPSTFNGSFYIENEELSGKGEGYGFLGKKLVYPNVFFKLELYDLESEGTEPTEATPTETNEATPAEANEITESTEIPSEIPTETPAEETETTEIETTSTEETETTESANGETTETTESANGETTETAVETPSETPASSEAPAETAPSPASEASPITGQAIIELETEIDGSCSKGKSFSYQLEEGKAAKIKQYSVETRELDGNGELENKTLEDDAVTLQISGTNVEVSTDYSTEIQSFGKDFLQDETNFLEIDLNKLGILAEEGTLTIALVYKDVEIVKTSQEISVEYPEFEENATGNITIKSSNILLNKGWNLISLNLNESDEGTDRIIPISAGKNLIGYSSGKEIELEKVRFVDSSGNSIKWTEAVENNKLSAYVQYFDADNPVASERKYKYVATSDLEKDDITLRKNKGYWVYANEKGSLVFPGVGGTLEGENYSWSDLRFSNGTDEKNITEAGEAGWLFGSGNTEHINYYENGYKKVCGTDECDSTRLESWRGYWIWSNEDNIQLIISAS